MEEKPKVKLNHHQVNLSNIIRMKKCHECKKQFVAATYHIYKMRKAGLDRYYCSYTCWRKAGGGSEKRPKGENL